MSHFQRLVKNVLCVFCLVLPVAAAADAATDTAAWIPYEMPNLRQLQGTALDMSRLLDAPAGKHGFLGVKGDKFFFEDGTEARFWGGNLFAEANFPTHKEAEALAERIAMTGANIIRMHHLDVVAPWTDFIVRKNLWGGQSPDTTRQFDQEMLDRFDYLIHCLKKRGVYIFLSHLSSRRIMPADGLPEPADSLDDIYAGLKIEGEFDEFLIGLQQEHLKNLLTHKNPHTGLALANDPALALTEIINEDSLLYLGMGPNFSTNSDYYKRMLQGQFNDWLIAKYRTREALAKAWEPQQGDQGGGLAGNEDPANKTVAFTYRFAWDAKARHDPTLSRQRNLDGYAFLCDTQGRYYSRMYEFLRGLGVKCPIAGSNHWIGDVADLHLNARLDYIDRHEYYAHPHGTYNYVAGQSISPATPMVKSDSLGTIGGLANRRVFGRPYTVSEWHNCLPNPYRAEGPIIMAAYASLQDWHPMQYAYLAFIDYDPEVINSFMVFFDPAHMNLLPASALLFHRRDVREALTGYFEQVPAQGMMDPAFSVAKNNRIALLGKYGLAFDDIAADSNAGNKDLATQASGSGRVFESVTGELRWDLDQGLLTVNSPRTQGVVGFTQGKPVSLADVVIGIENDFAVVVVSALDGGSIRDAKRLLVSTSARAQWSGMEFDEERGVITKSGRPPFLMEPVTGSVTILPGRSATVYRLSSSGKRLGKVIAGKTAQGTTFDLRATNRCMHYEIVRE